MQPFAGRDVDPWRSEEARAPGGGDTASPGSHVVCCAWLNSSWDTIGGNAFGALTAVSGSLRPQTLVPLRRSGVGRERKPPETCAWEPKPRCGRGSGTSSTGCPAGKTRSGAAAAHSCNQGGTTWLFRKGPTVWGPSPRLQRHTVMGVLMRRLFESSALLRMKVVPSPVGRSM